MYEMMKAWCGVRTVGMRAMRKTSQEQLAGVDAGLTMESEATGGFRRIQKLEDGGVPRVRTPGKEAHLQRER